MRELSLLGLREIPASVIASEPCEHSKSAISDVPLLTDFDSPTTARRGNVPAKGNNITAALWAIGIYKCRA